MAQKAGARSIAFPAISCGVYGYPVEGAAEIAVRECRSALDSDAMFDEVILVAFGGEVADTYARLLGSG